MFNDASLTELISGQISHLVLIMEEVDDENNRATISSGEVWAVVCIRTLDASLAAPYKQRIVPKFTYKMFKFPDNTRAPAVSPYLILPCPDDIYPAAPC